MHNKDNTDWTLLARYLSGECPEEKPTIEQWLESDPESKRLYQMMKAVWEVKEARPPLTDLEIMWQAVEKKSGTSIAYDDKKNDVSVTDRRLFAHWLKPSLFTRVAAAIIVIVGLSLIIGKLTNIFPFNGHPQYRTITVEHGTHHEITLNDGTSITLDAGSTFRYPLKFDESYRKVQLDGEAYFEVAHDTDRPFIVQVHDAEIGVLGTKFNIRGWEIAGDIRVVVAEGKVSLKSIDFESRDSVVISAGQLSVMRPDEPPSQPRSVDVSKYLGWLRNDIMFEDAPVYEVIDQIERWYDIQITLSDSSIGSERVSVNIKKKSLTDVLDLLSVLTGLSYKHKGRNVNFHN